MITDKHIKDLLEKYLYGSLSPEEYKELLRYFDSSHLEEDARQLLYDHFNSEKTEDFVPNDSIQHVMDNAFMRIENRMGKQKYSWARKWLPYAAAILTILSLSVYWLMNTSPTHKTNQITATTADILPGSNRATLILENGKSIVLDENNPEIKMKESGIFYQDGTAVIEKVPVQHVTLSIPRKGQYQLNLPDGTKVWLNTESQLVYPTAFQGKERLVELKGEAYFEVTHDPEHPFIVKSDGQRVKVLGTSFNINAYTNEPSLVTTLVNGRIELEDRMRNTKKVLIPGQQAIVGIDLFTVNHVDVQLSTAWKEGKFRFKDASLREVVRQLERWYDIEVDYSHIPDDRKIFASIKRNKKLSSVLTALEETSGVTFRLEGRRLMIMP